MIMEAEKQQSSRICECSLFMPPISITKKKEEEEFSLLCELSS